MSWYMLVANPVLNVVLWLSMFMILGIVGVIIYFMYDWLKSDVFIFVNKDGSLEISSKVIPRDNRISGKFQKGKHTYLLEPDAVHTKKNFPQWKKVYVFDEGSPMPRVLGYKKDAWFSTETITKILNDTRIKMLTKEPIDANLKLFIILGAIGGIAGAFASAITLAMQLGIFGG